MTLLVALKAEDGLVLAADSRGSRAAENVTAQTKIPVADAPAAQNEATPAERLLAPTVPSVFELTMSLSSSLPTGWRAEVNAASIVLSWSAWPS
ncbi:MAG TPA: hypothetical protein VEJ84_10460 [Acidimicrobiales bacterium]|nr:hypothetical protein [Acidimicrobiales bacterium]